MQAINNQNIINYDNMSPNGVIGSASFVYDDSAKTIKVTDASTIPSPDAFKIMHVDIYDRFGGKRYGHIDVAGGDLTISLLAITKPLASITVTNGGSAYAAAPTISFTGGGGTGATAKAYVTGGVITKILITNPGTGYTSAPTVVITPVSGGTAGAATAVVSTQNDQTAMNASKGFAVEITLVTVNGIAKDGTAFKIANTQTTGNFDVEK
jgi:hypothetical protein